MSTKVHGSHIGTSGGASVGAELTYDAPVASNTEYTIYCKGGAGLTAKNHTSANITYKLGGSPNVTSPSGGYWQTSSNASHGDGTSWVQQTGTIHFNRTHASYTATVYASITTNSHTSTAKYTFTVSPRASYTVSFNANGGSNAPSSQTKWYGENLTLSSTVPTRTNYIFKGWSTSSTGSVSYASGGTYTGNASITLYAVWELGRNIKVNSASAYRSDESGTASDEGTYGKVSFSYNLSGQLENTGTVTARYRESDGSTWTTVSGISQGSNTKAQGTTSLNVSVSFIVSGLSVDKSYVVELTATDTDGHTATTTTYVSTAFFTMDFKAGGKEIAFGSSASDSNIPSNGLFKCGMDANFLGRVTLGKAIDVPYAFYSVDVNTTMVATTSTWLNPSGFSTSSYSHIIGNSNYFEANSTGIKVKKSGVYLLLAQAHYNTNANGVQMAMRLYNTSKGNIGSYSFNCNSSTSWGALNIQAIAQIDAGNLIQPQFEKYTNTTPTWKPSSTKMSIILLHEA